MNSKIYATKFILKLRLRLILNSKIDITILDTKINKNIIKKRFFWIQTSKMSLQTRLFYLYLI